MSDQPVDFENDTKPMSDVDEVSDSPANGIAKVVPGTETVRAQQKERETKPVAMPQFTHCGYTKEQKIQRMLDEPCEKTGAIRIKDKIPIKQKDIGYIVGKQGVTKAKLMRVSGAFLDCNDEEMTVVGTQTQVDRAKKYINYLCMQSQNRPITCTMENDGDGDLTILEIPKEAKNAVLGEKSGGLIRSLEDDWGVIAFFAENDSEDGASHNLCLFGEHRGRRGAMLKCLSLTENVCPGHFQRNKEQIIHYDDKALGETWLTDELHFQKGEYNFALGTRGMTLRKLQASSGCIVQYFMSKRQAPRRRGSADSEEKKEEEEEDDGDNGVALFCGHEDERERVKQYMSWMFEHLEGTPLEFDPASRDDVDVIEVPKMRLNFLTGKSRGRFIELEQEYGVMLFIMGRSGRRVPDAEEPCTDPSVTERIVIAGRDRNRLGCKLRLMAMVEMDKQHKGFYSNTFVEGKNKDKGLGCEYRNVPSQDVAYCLGKGGTTKDKLGRASGCFLQYVSDWAIFAGTREQRKKCQNYLDWLLLQREGRLELDVKNRNDVLAVHIPDDSTGFVMGKESIRMREVEQNNDVFCFMADDVLDENKNKVFIFGLEHGFDAFNRAEIDQCAPFIKPRVGRESARADIRALLREKEKEDRRNERDEMNDRRYRSPRRGDSRDRRGGYKGSSKGSKGGRDNSRGRSNKGGKGKSSFGKGKGKRSDSRDGGFRGGYKGGDSRGDNRGPPRRGGGGGGGNSLEDRYNQRRAQERGDGGRRNMGSTPVGGDYARGNGGGRGDYRMR